MNYNDFMSSRIKPTSATMYILMALIPYTESNLKLAYHPNLFLNDLDRLTEHSMHNIKLSYKRAVDKGWIKIKKNNVELSLEARQSIELYMARKLTGSELMIIFDIPENLAYKRRKLRAVLRYFEFKQVQQSVWSSERDFKNILAETVDDLDITKYVKLYEASKISPYVRSDG